MSAITQLVVPYTCPQGHRTKSAFTREDLEKAIAEGALHCHCEDCGRAYSIQLTSAGAEDLRRLLRNASAEQLAKPSSPKAEVWLD